MTTKTLKNGIKLTQEQKAIKLAGYLENIEDVLASYENLTYKAYPKKNKIAIQIENENKNLFEVFYTLKGRFHVCTKYNLSKHDTSAQYHEKWDMGWDLYTNTYTALEEIIDFILGQYNESIG